MLGHPGRIWPHNSAQHRHQLRNSEHDPQQVSRQVVEASADLRIRRLEVRVPPSAPMFSQLDALIIFVLLVPIVSPPKITVKVVRLAALGAPPWF